MNTILKLIFNSNIIIACRPVIASRSKAIINKILGRGVGACAAPSLAAFPPTIPSHSHECADMNNFIKDNLNLNLSIHSSGNNVIYDQYQNIYHGLLVDYEVFVFGLFIAFFLASLLVLISYIFGTQLKILDKEKLSLFECGFIPLNDSRQLFTVNFYRISILFILFDIEISFLFPWSTSFLSSILPNNQMVLGQFITNLPLETTNIPYNSFSLFYFYSIYMFLTLLIIGIYYEYKAKALEVS